MRKTFGQSGRDSRTGSISRPAGKSIKSDFSGILGVIGQMDIVGLDLPTMRDQV